MTQRRVFMRLFATVILSSALLLAGCGQGADDFADVSDDTVIATDQNGSADPTPSLTGDDSASSDVTDDTSDSDSTEIDVLTDGEVDLDKVEAELEAIENELDSLAFPDDSMFDDAAGALF